MKPTTFKEQTIEIAKNQPQYQTLPALVDKKKGVVISCWKLSWREIFTLLWTRRLWLSTMTFNEPLQPLYPTVNKQEAITQEWKKLSENDQRSI